MADLTCTGGFITPTEIVDAVNARVEENIAITPATNTKITYDAKGLVTSGEAATTADIADSTDKRYVTDDESTVIDNTSNTNSGDNATNTQYSGLVSNIQSDLALGTPTPTTYPITNTDGTGFSIPEANTTEAGLLGSDKWDEIVANSLKDTNVPTELSNGTASETVVNITSDGGTDDIAIATASTTIAGVMTKAIFDEHVVNNGKETNEVSDLALGTPTAITYPITNSDGTGFSIPEADTTNAGLLGSDKWDEIVANSLKDTNVPTELSNGTDSVTVVNITSDGGTDDVGLTAATTLKAGIMTKAIFDEHVVNNGKDTNEVSDLALGTLTATTMPITNSDGNGVTLIEADTDNAGILGSDKWDEIVANSLKDTNVPTELSNGTASETVVNITSDGGTDDLVITAASASKSGIMTKAIFDEHVVNNGKTSNIQADLALGTPTATTYPITNTDGTGFSIPEADTTNAGLLGSDKWDEIVANTTHIGLTNPHIDWTIDYSATDMIDVNNYINTEYDNTDFVDLTSAQSVGGIKTFTAAPVLPSTTIIEVATDTSPQLGGDLEFNGKTANVSAVRGLTDTSGTGTITLAYASGDMRQHTATGNCLLAFSGFPDGDVCGYILDCYDFGDYTITYPANTRFAAGTAPDYTSNGYDRILIMKDRDNVYTITVIALDHKAEV